VPDSSSSSESIVITSTSFRFFDIDDDGDDDVIVAGELGDGDNADKARGDSTVATARAAPRDARAAWASFRIAFIFRTGHSAVVEMQCCSAGGPRRKALIVELGQRWGVLNVDASKL
jgi:hypothetical protein